MCLKNTATLYGVVAQSLHWLMALLILGMLAVGIYMADLPLSPDKVWLIGLHKATGMVVLMLVGLRLCWRLVNIIPPLPASMPVWQKGAAHVSHYLLYFCMFAMPLTGWLMSSAAGFPVSVYGVFLMPDLIGKDDATRKFMAQAHELMAYGLMALLVAHVGAALYHHFIHKDDILKRMLPCRKTSSLP